MTKNFARNLQTGLISLLRNHDPETVRCITDIGIIYNTPSKIDEFTVLFDNIFYQIISGNEILVLKDGVEIARTSSNAPFKAAQIVAGDIINQINIVKSID